MTIIPGNCQYAGVAINLVTQAERQAVLYLMRGSVTDDGVHSPAASIEIHGDQTLLALRDALNAWRPPTSDVLDARRYRYLRECHEWSDEVLAAADCGNGTRLDAAIDAAIAAKAKT